MEDIIIKYNSLDVASQKSVQDYIDYLLSKIKKKKGNKKHPNNGFNYESYKQKLMQNQIFWSDEDVKRIEEAGEKINFNIPEW